MILDNVPTQTGRASSTKPNSVEIQYEMQLLFTIKGKEVWLSLKAENLPDPYRYNNPKQARWQLNVCYPMPLENHRKRIIAVDKNGEMLGVVGHKGNITKEK